jgi:hypothetical protein
VVSGFAHTTFCGWLGIDGECVLVLCRGFAPLKSLALRRERERRPRRYGV